MSTAAYSDQFKPFVERMERKHLPPTFIGSFAHYYDQLTLGITGLIPEGDIDPVDDVLSSDGLAEVFGQYGTEALARTVLIKVNGGLGTSMGLERAKSLLVVKNGLTFMDIVALQAIDAGVPLVLMNSFATEGDSLSALRAYPELDRGVPLSFRQHMAPKIAQADLSPASWPANPALEWYPPGHGDLYTALLTSGMLESLLKTGREYAFISNADNLGAVIDLGILGYMHVNKVPFLMEVADRSEADRKGGHLARSRDGRLILRESAQCSAADQNAFQDVSRHRFFNTNNLWVDLRALHRLMEERHHHLGLPIIRNPKTVDPRDPDSTPVYQVETAMGAAIAVFPDARALRVPRERFAPVKTTEDLFVVRSDAFVLSSGHRVVADPERRLPLPRIDLDPTHYRFASDLDFRFPHGIPSLAGCVYCRIMGDFRFGKDVRLVGEVLLENFTGEPVEIEDGEVLSGRRRFLDPPQAPA